MSDEYKQDQPFCMPKQIFVFEGCRLTNMLESSETLTSSNQSGLRRLMVREPRAHSNVINTKTILFFLRRRATITSQSVFKITGSGGDVICNLVGGWDGVCWLSKFHTGEVHPLLKLSQPCRTLQSYTKPGTHLLRQIHGPGTEGTKEGGDDWKMWVVWKTKRWGEWVVLRSLIELKEIRQERSDCGSADWKIRECFEPYQCVV